MTPTPTLSLPSSKSQTQPSRLGRGSLADRAGSGTSTSSPLKRLREAAGLTQRQVAEQASVNRKTVSRIENGLHQDGAAVERIARVLKADPSDLVGARPHDVLEGLPTGSAGRLVFNPTTHSVTALQADMARGTISAWNGEVGGLLRNRGTAVYVYREQDRILAEIACPTYHRLRREQRRARDSSPLLGDAATDVWLRGIVVALLEEPTLWGMPLLVLVDQSVLEADNHKNWRRLEALAAEHSVAVALLHLDPRAATPNMTPGLEMSPEPSDEPDPVGPVNENLRAAGTRQPGEGPRDRDYVPIDPEDAKLPRDGSPGAGPSVEQQAAEAKLAAGYAQQRRAEAAANRGPFA